MKALDHNIHDVRNRIESVAAKVGKSPDDIILVAVTKTQPPEVINYALRAGITNFGENRVQEAMEKLPLITAPFECFHFIGHLQSNKVNLLEQMKPCLIHSVDSIHLARSISQAATTLGLNQEILLEVNVSGEASKYGFDPLHLSAFVEEISAFPALQVRGLMTIGRLSDSPENSRQDFRMLASLFHMLEKMNLPNIKMDLLSMGMSNDFEIAIEEGSNLVRIGSAIFGEREVK